MKYYVKAKPTTSLCDADNKHVTELLWGDLVHPCEDCDQAGGKSEAWARGQRGWAEKSELRKQSSNFNGLLEIYVIDAGVANFAQMTRKGAANCLRWKFYQDLRRDGIHLHSLTASHPDFDHYGGMLDLLSGELYDGRGAGAIDDPRLPHLGAPGSGLRRPEREALVLRQDDGAQDQEHRVPAAERHRDLHRPDLRPGQRPHRWRHGALRHHAGVRERVRHQDVQGWGRGRFGELDDARSAGEQKSGCAIRPISR